MGEVEFKKKRGPVKADHSQVIGMTSESRSGTGAGAGKYASKMDFSSAGGASKALNGSAEAAAGGASAGAGAGAGASMGYSVLMELTDQRERLAADLKDKEDQWLAIVETP